MDTLLLQAGEMDEMAGSLASEMASPPTGKDIEIPEAVPVSFLNYLSYNYFFAFISSICFDLFEKRRLIPSIMFHQ